MKTVDYYFCLNSPWSMFASKQLIELLPTLDVQLNLKPISIGELYAATKFPAVADRPQYLQNYRLAELSRWSKRLAIPIHLKPAFFPANEVAAHALVLSAEKEKGAGLEAAASLGHALWSEEANIADAAFLDAQRSNFGVSELISNDESEAIMSANTKELMARGGFGVPTFIVDDELIWGQDRLDFLVEAVK